MFKKLKILTLLQLSDKLKIKKNLTFPQKLGQFGKTILAMVVSFGIFCALFYVIFNLMSFQASENLLILVLLIMQVLSIISSTTSLTDLLYLSKDTL